MGPRQRGSASFPSSGSMVEFEAVPSSFAGLLFSIGVAAAKNARPWISSAPKKGGSPTMVNWEAATIPRTVEDGRPPMCIRRDDRRKTYLVREILRIGPPFGPARPPASTRSKVLLPAPLWPNQGRGFPHVSTASETRSRAVRIPPEYFREPSNLLPSPLFRTPRPRSGNLLFQTC